VENDVKRLLKEEIWKRKKEKELKKLKKKPF
jgi:hypothetical protein